MDKKFIIGNIYTQLDIRHHSRITFPEKSNAKELTLIESTFYTVAFFRMNLYTEGYRGWLGNTENSQIDFLPVALAAINAHDWSLAARKAGFASASDSEPDMLFTNLAPDLYDFLWEYYKEHKSDLPIPDEEYIDRWAEHEANWKKWASET